ncbi:MAG: CPBP family intramembrane metalloprotease [Anaerolineae bacterium]|nr:CPBP family intramembrane metalloprotease [Anaerolineae bacterium]
MVDTKRVWVFLGFAFGIAWAGGLVIYLTGGLQNSMTLGSPRLTVALLILSTVYMGAPALAHILTRLITREGWQDVYLRPHLRRGWLFWVICWLAPAILTYGGMAVYFLLFPQHFDPQLGKISELFQSMSRQTGQAVPQFNPWVVVVAQSLQAVLIAPVINALPVFGEEFGWRAYLQPKLMPLGGRKAILLMGIIWGLWHAPVILMGHNYGLAYPGAPWLGVPVMVWFTLVLGTFLGWGTIKAGSVWPAVIGHGAINGIAGVSLFFVKGDPNLILGPSPAGLIGSSAFALVALIIFFCRDALQMPESGS